MSLFSGCGGSSTGYKLAGFNVLYANEFVRMAQRTYFANHPDTYLDVRDIREVKGREILKTCGLKAGELDILDGSPPCQAFSSAGTREQGWNEVKKYSDTAQRTDDLYFEFARILKELKPKVFITENVPGLISGVAKGYFLDIVDVLEKTGYKVIANVLNSEDYGVPQSRRRLFTIGLREDLTNLAALTFPNKATGTLTVREVFPHIAYIRRTYKGRMAMRPSDVPSPTITASDAINSLTAGFSCGGWVETKEGGIRKYTLKELRVICGFPSDFKLVGTFEERWERLGRAVPPLMMYYLADHVRSKVLSKVWKHHPPTGEKWRAPSGLKRIIHD